MEELIECDKCSKMKPFENLTDHDHTRLCEDCLVCCEGCGDHEDKVSEYSDIKLCDWCAKDQGKYLESRDIIDSFNDNIKPLVIEQYGENDEPAMNESFCNYIDSLAIDGRISKEMAHSIVLP